MILLNGKRIDSTVGDALPIGTLSPFVGLVAPKGYLICMGQLVDKAKYPELWELCGDTFGPSTTTQFYLPDLRGQTIAGYKQGDSTFGTLGALIGGLTHVHTTGNHTLTTTEMPKHSHTRGTMNITGSYTVTSDSGSAGLDANGSGTGAIGAVNSYGYGSPVDPGSGGWVLGGCFDFDASRSWTGATSIEGGDGAHNHGNTGSASNIQPTAVMNWIIKASMLAVVTGNIEDTLTSTSTTDALSAKQGKVLNDIKINISDIVDNCTTNDASKVLSAKQGKVLNDKFSNYVLTSSIVNNLTSTSTNVPLSAAQGKTLNDKVTNLKRVELFSGSWVRGETKTIDTSSYTKLEILMSLNPSGSAYNTIYTISYDNAGNRTGLISGVAKCMNGYFYQVEIQKQANNKIFFDYGAYAHQESMSSWTQDSASKGVITKLYGYKEI